MAFVADLDNTITDNLIFRRVSSKGTLAASLNTQSLCEDRKEAVIGLFRAIFRDDTSQ